MADLYAIPRGGSREWVERHNTAINRPHAGEAAIITTLRGWAALAKNHKDRYGSVIGHDGVLGAGWYDIGSGMRTLLNGELGRLDGGTLDAFIGDTLRENGVNPDTGDLFQDIAEKDADDE